ncbi:hypothetical protein [Streptomyces chartreusis]|uniref:hypothetical protein n=1 Tax=Streptomyces chartreusis TaxID=1969 RepID=UPI00380ABDCE
MLHRARPRAAVLRHLRGDAGSNPIEFLFLATGGIVCGSAVFVAIRAKAQFDAFVARHPTPPLLPDFTIPWATIGFVAGAVALGALITLAVVAQRAVSQARQPSGAAAPPSRHATIAFLRASASASSETWPTTSWTNWSCSRP